MADTQNRHAMLRMTFDAQEAQLLLDWAQRESHMHWKVQATREAAQELCDRLRYAVSVQCPEVHIEGDFGDFT